MVVEGHNFGADILAEEVQRYKVGLDRWTALGVPVESQAVVVVGIEQDADEH